MLTGLVSKRPKPSEHRVRDMGLARLKAQMILEGVTQPRLAEALGISVRSLRTFLCNPTRSRKAQARAEKFFRRAFWSDPVSFERERAVETNER